VKKTDNDETDTKEKEETANNEQDIVVKIVAMIDRNSVSIEATKAVLQAFDQNPKVQNCLLHFVLFSFKRRYV
jgi:hypothetical protein